MATTVGMAAANATAAGLPREVLKWVQSLDLSYSVKNVRRAFSNGFLVAEIFNRYFPSDLSMHTFLNTENYAKKRDNWQQLQLFFNRRKIPIQIHSIDALILNEQDTTLEFVKQIYSLLTERQLLPPVKLYENQDNQAPMNQENRDLLGLQEEETIDKESATQINQQSLLGGNQSQKSPQKSIAIKGPPRVIDEKLEIDNYKGVEVKEVIVKPINQSIAQIRAAREQSSIHSQRLDTQSVGVMEGLSHHRDSRHQIVNSQSQHIGGPRSQGSGHSPLGAAQDPGHLLDQVSQGGRQRHRTITDVLHERITQFVSRSNGLAQSNGQANGNGDANQNASGAANLNGSPSQQQPSSTSNQVNYQQEFAQLKIENDMVNTFFDEIHKMSDHFTFNFVESLKMDFEAILQTLYASATECATFFSFMLCMLRRLSPIEGSFASTLILCKQMAIRINTDAPQSPASDFNKFFQKHLFRSYCALLRECPTKRQQICELIYAHCQHDLTLRIKIVQSLKKHLREDELVYGCQAYLLQQETSFNEQWFDVFLYYALIGLSNQRTLVRVYSLNMLTTIAKHNPDSMLEVCSAVANLSEETYWEVKTQVLEFATAMLHQFRSHSHLLAAKDDLKSGAAKSGSPQGGDNNIASGARANGNSAAPGSTADKTVVKNSLTMCIEMIRKCFNIMAPKSVQKLGLFKIQHLLNDFKLLYSVYIEVLIQVDPEIKAIILSDEPIRTGEEIFFSLGLVSFNYKLRSDLSDIDPVLLCNSLIDYVITNNFESLEREHMQVISVCAGTHQHLNPIVSDSWFKVYQKLKDYLLVSICDCDLVNEALDVLHNFLTDDHLKYQVQDETATLMVKSIELLYNGESEDCKDRFKAYLDQVASSDDSALRKFFKGVLQKMYEDHSATFSSSNIVEIKDKL